LRRGHEEEYWTQGGECNRKLEKNGVMRGYVIYTAHKISLECGNQGG